jgi:hypothetical protein
MFRKTKVFIILFALFAICGCSMQNTLPTPEIRSVSAAFPEGSAASLEIESDVPGMIRVIGASSDNIVSGTISYNVSGWRPKLVQNGSKVSLVQPRNSKQASAGYTTLWNLRLGDAKPFDLIVKTDLNEGHWNLSGLPITGLFVTAGAGKNGYTFDDPNPVIMKTFNLTAGTGDITVEGLLDFNCPVMKIKAGHGTATIRFTGDGLSRDVQVSIEGGSGSMVVYLSSNTRARIHVDKLDKIVPVVGLKQEGNDFQTAEYSPGHSPELEISIKSGSGRIELKTF